PFTAVTLPSYVHNSSHAGLAKRRMDMRLKLPAIGLFLALCLVLAANVGAQSPSAEWAAWNTQITAHSNSPQLDIAETQVVNVTAGPLQAGERNYSEPVTVQAVYLAVNNGQPQQLPQGDGPGTYQVSNSNGDVVVDYQLPTPANTG